MSSWFDDFIICSINFDDIYINHDLYRRSIVFEIAFILHSVLYNLIVHNIKIMNIICKGQIIFLTINMQLKYVCLFIAVFIFYCLKFCYAEMKTFVSLSASKLNLIPKTWKYFHKFVSSHFHELPILFFVFLLFLTKCDSYFFFQNRLFVALCYYFVVV